MKGAVVAWVVLGALMFAVSAAPARAQQRARSRAEARVDYIGPNPHAVHAGLGVNVPLGTYVRLGLIGAGGMSWKEGRSGPSARVDVLGRFSFDPFRERQWALSGGGGLSVRYDQVASGRDYWRPLLAVILDLEGPRTGSIAPALQLGLGGGTRVGLILRGAAPDRR